MKSALSYIKYFNSTSQSDYADSKSIEALLRRLEEKISIGELLELKAKGQNLKLAESAVGADEVYTYDWALNQAEVNRLLSD